MRELVLLLAKALADHPDQVSVQESEEGGTLTLSLTVAEEDKGRVIGKQGKVIKAVRAVVAAAAAKAGKRSMVEVN